MSNFYKEHLIHPENYGYVNSYKNAVDKFVSNNQLFYEMIMTHFAQKKIRVKGKIQKVPFPTVQKFTDSIERLMEVSPYCIESMLSIPSTKGFSLLYVFSLYGLLGFGRKHFLVFQLADNPNIISGLYEVI